MIAKPFRVWRGDWPRSDWFHDWDEEDKKALAEVLSRESQYSDWYNTERLSEELDDEPEDLPSEESYLKRAQEERQRTQKRKDSALEKKLKQYNKLKEELGL